MPDPHPLATFTGGRHPWRRSRHDRDRLHPGIAAEKNGVLAKPNGDAASAEPRGGPVRVLAVGVDPKPLHALRRLAPPEGALVAHAPDPQAAIRAIRREPWNLLIVSLDGEPHAEPSWWSEALRDVPHPPRVIALIPEPSAALEAAHSGVSEFLSVPLRRQFVSDLIRRVREAETEAVLPLPHITPATGGIVSGSPNMLPVFHTIAQVATTSASVLVTGESGTGKELVARAIHQISPRSSGPFIAFNCAAIPEHLLESELFGHEKGAFTGAVSRRIGRFERAAGGTLFLDEIGEMSLPLQSKILRAIQEREIERIGGTEVIPVETRLIAAMNSDPEAQVKAGRLRGDLYYRLAVVTIALPRLADRGDDVCLLTAYFLRTIGERYGKHFTGISSAAQALLEQRDWPGNIRELRNAIERAVVVAEDDVLRAEQLPQDPRAAPALSPLDRAPMTLREVEMAHIARVLGRTNGHIGEAARILGLHRNTLSRKLKEYGL